MAENDIKCPDCGKVVSFQNIMRYDDEQVEIIAIMYALRCLMCGHVFMPDARLAKTATKEQLKEIMETAKVKLKDGG